ncbi:cilia- and flagella-associated protein 161 isoform X2 [Osmerus eperlanus]|uniref:cilia- and flagella-associated protein 161 isoform X2 n=1 Tax=Osmerus eperlanus TaxID=29151 RepID=UPI002E0D720E
MANIRTYGTSVRVGNWREDVTLEEDTLKDFLERKEKGELTVQKTGYLKQNILREVNLSVSRGGSVCFGDVVMLVNVGGSNRDHCAISINADITNLGKGPSASIQSPCGVSGGKSLQPCTRIAFVINSVDGSAEGEPLHYEQSFTLSTTTGFAGGLYLTSDHKTFQKERLEHEGLPVPANAKVMISHCKTNHALAVLGDHILWTPYGREYEVAAQTFLDSHKAERDVNHWLLVTSDPAGEGLTLLERPQTQTCNKPTKFHKHSQN